MRIFLFKGDLTILDTEAVVNAANGMGPMGGGVAYAIKNVGGSIIEEEATNLCKKDGPFKPGSVYVTTGGKKWKYVVHAVTMTYPAELADYDSTKQALTNAIRKAMELNIKTLALPALGMGVGELQPQPLARQYASVFTSMKDENIDIVVCAFDKRFLMELINEMD
ncbi:macro domain-containing protein [Coprothermobacter platensis]|uniref:macro domain-containing protein n=1 Tax=Coprothermobacter platensis TaxID=108819 RepID=UPI0003A33DA6|nr:macro domain-containing protein [Coprothermobacter platensis]